MRRFWVVAAALLLTVSGCVKTETETSAMNSPGPALVVERFLQAANANDLRTMTQLFGTEGKTIDQLEPRTTAERRMYVLASLLRHDDFAIKGQRRVPGRLSDATDMLVELTQGERKVIVPFLVVRKKGGGWIIETIDIQPLTTSQ